MIRPPCVLVLLAACAHAPAPGPVIDVPPELATTRTDALERHAKASMGTLVEIALPREPRGPEREKALEEAWEAFAFVEREMNEWNEQSPLSALNRGAGGSAVTVGPELFGVLERALEMARASDGAFDPTWAALRGLWKFGSAQDGTVPSDEAIEARRGLVDWRKLSLDRAKSSARLLTAGMAIGLGGIAKGWAVDRAGAALRAHGEPAFLIEAGGEILASGTPGAGRRWTAGVQDPRGNGPFALIELGDEACSTSGDYERAFIKDGVRYHHIIDPRTARPARASQSATVLAPRSIDADALTKVLFILGWERGIPLVERLGGLAFVVAADGTVHTSAALLPRVRALHATTPSSLDVSRALR